MGGPKDLHSSMERLKADDTAYYVSVANKFTFQYGEIKRWGCYLETYGNSLFTFQYGEIKRYELEVLNDG